MQSAYSYAPVSCDTPDGKSDFISNFDASCRGVMELIAHYQTLYHRMALTMENMISDASLRPEPDMEYEEEEDESDAVDFEEAVSFTNNLFY